MTNDTVNNPFANLIAKAWTDESFKAALIADPVATLKAEGIDVPAGVTVNVLEDTETVSHLVLPPVPKDGEISDDQLEGVTGGVAFAIPALAWMGSSVVAAAKVFAIKMGLKGAAVGLAAGLAPGVVIKALDD